jgi:hypothetical protein
VREMKDTYREAKKGPTNCSKCVWSMPISKKALGCRVGGIRDVGSNCNIMTGETIGIHKTGRMKGLPIMEMAYINKKKLTNIQILMCLKALGNYGK